MGIDTEFFFYFTFVPVEDDTVSEAVFKKLEVWLKKQKLCWEVEDGGDEIRVSFNTSFRMDVKEVVENLARLAKKLKSLKFGGSASAPYMSSWGDYESGVVYIDIFDEAILIKVKGISCHGDENSFEKKLV